MKAIMLGASRGMGRAVARRLAEKGESLFLLGRDPEELNKSAHDLQVRGAPGDVGVAHCDLMTPEGFEVALDAAWQFLGDVDTVIITAAAFQTQEALEYPVEAPGRYRIEVHVDVTHLMPYLEAHPHLHREFPWIYSNPIRVQ